MNNSKVALVIIDVQVGAFDGVKIPSLSKASEFLENIKSLQHYFRANSNPVIFVQDNGEVGGAFEKGTSHWEIHPDVSPLPDEMVIQKNSSNAFTDTNLEDHLNNLGVKTIVVCGLHSEHCVTETSLNAIKLGYEVVIASDAHGSSRDNIEESIKVIDEQNQALEEAGAIVVSTKDVQGLNFGDLVESERLIIGRFKESDFESTLLMMSDADIMRYTGFQVPQSKEKVRSLLSKWKKDGLYKKGVWAVRDKDERKLIGWVMLKDNANDDLELGYMLHKPQWGKGYATEIAKAMIKYGSIVLNAKTITACTSYENIASIRVLEKIGMKRIDKNTEGLDGIYFEINFE